MAGHRHSIRTGIEIHPVVHTLPTRELNQRDSADIPVASTVSSRASVVPMGVICTNCRHCRIIVVDGAA